MAIRLGCENVTPPYDCADYRNIITNDYPAAETWASEWLSTLGLGFVFDGIDFEKFDRLNQYLFFQKAAYFYSITNSVIDKVSNIETFYILCGEKFLPQDFYLDSDIAASIVAYVCETRGVPFKTITMRQRPMQLWAAQRPFMKEGVEATILDQTIPGCPGHRVGVVPAALVQAQQFLGDIGSVSLHVFSTMWGGPKVEGRRDFTHEEVLCLIDAAKKLTEVWIGFLKKQRDDKQYLPDYIMKNQSVRAQFEYIIRSRWLQFARYTIDAEHYVSNNPLDLFIYCDHFFPESVILANLYRRRGAKTIMALHAVNGPVKRLWGSWSEADAGITSTKFGAEWLRKTSGLRDVSVCGVPPALTNKEAIHELRNRIMAQCGGKKIVTFINNCGEVGVPLLDLAAHYETVSVLSAPPDHLKDKVFVVVRMKRSTLSDDEKFYTDILKFPSESIDNVAELTFSQCIQITDCAISINLATGGFVEVMQRHVPLIYVETATMDRVLVEESAYYSALPCIKDKHKIWDEIERVLFDEEYRRQVIDFQSAFITAQTESDFPSDEKPLRRIIQRHFDDAG
jgi:hypothetical protein